MDPYYRPLTIHDLVLDPTLDSSPIAHSMPPKDRLVPGYAVLVTSSLLGLLLVLAPAAFRGPAEQAWRTVPFHTNHMDVSLGEDLSPGFNGGGSGGKSPSPGKGLDRDLIVQAVTAFSPIDVSLLTPSAMDLPSVGERMGNLPFAIPNGDGRPRAMGRGNGNGVGGNGNGVGGIASKPFDYKLVPVFQAPANYRLKPGESGDNTIVEVLVTVEEDGMVSRVQALSGPEFLYPSVIAAARRWRFENLSLHGLRGPMDVKIRFACKLI
jgi:hypothetical protein